MQGAQVLRNETYLFIRRNDERCSATQQIDFLRSRCYFFRFSGLSALTAAPACHSSESRISLSSASSLAL